MVGRTLSAVTLHEPGAALTGNFLKVQLASLRSPNLMADLRIGGLTRDGLREAGPIFAESGGACFQLAHLFSRASTLHTPQPVCPP
jgi:hypothetical protein